MKTKLFLAASLLFVSASLIAQDLETEILTVKENLQRKSQGLKNILELNNQNDTLNFVSFDKEGRIVRFLQFKKCPYADAGKEFQRLKQELTFTYDDKSNISAVTNFEEHVSGTAYGVNSRGEHGEYGLPTVGGPYKRYSQTQKGSWTYTYDKDGKVMQKVGFGERCIAGGRHEYGFSFYIPENGNCRKSKYVYKYDTDGKVSEITSYWPDTSRTIYHRVEYSYDKYSNMKEQRWYSWENKLTDRVSFSYDNGGKLGEKNEGNSYKHVYAYDDAGNKVREECYYLLNGNLSGTCTWKYDSRNNVTEETCSGSLYTGQKFFASTYTYDDKGRITKRVKNNIAPGTKEHLVLTSVYSYYN